MEKKILDVTCGSRTIWFNKHHPAAVYCDKRREQYHHLWKMEIDKRRKEQRGECKMSMTREEAIEELERLLRHWDDLENDKRCFWGYDQEAVALALSALRPVSREQVEKVFHGCEMCREEKKVKSDNFCGAATMRIVGDSTDLRGDEKKIKFFGHIYAPNFSVRFCPFCGKPLTDEAVQMVMERLEALHEDNSCS